MVAGSLKQALLRWSGESGCPLEVNVLPLADGGDGSLEAIELACRQQGLKISVHKCQVNGICADSQHEATWLELDDLNIVELACACGLALWQDKTFEPMTSNTFALGQVIADVIRHSQTTGIKRKIVVCLGGSASTDGGMGMLHALGANFYDRQGKLLPPGGDSLEHVSRCDLANVISLTRQFEFEVACDVESPLLGKNGAIAFSAQKGASLDEIVCLERGLANYAKVLEEACGKESGSVSGLSGTGAAGGTAFALACVLKAKLISGFDFVSGLLNLESKVRWADLIISGEGRFDPQSFMGKASGQLAKLCSKYSKRFWILPGASSRDNDWEVGDIDWRDHGIEIVCATAREFDQALPEDIEATLYRLLRVRL